MIIQSLPMVLYLEPYDSKRRVPNYLTGDIEAITGFTYDELASDPQIWFERLHPDDRIKVIAALEAADGRARCPSNIAGSAPTAASSISSTRRCS